MSIAVVASPPEGEWAILAGSLGRYSLPDDATDRVTLLRGLHPRTQRIAGGYFNPAGNRYVSELLTNCLAAASSPYEIKHHLRRARPAIEKALAGFRPKHAAYARSVPEALWVGVVDGRVQTWTLNWVTGAVVDCTGEVRAIPPYGLDPVVCVQLLDDYAAVLSGCQDGNAIRRATDDLFAAFHERCPDTVTKEFELAGVTRTRTGFERWRLLGDGAKARATVPIDTSAETFAAGGATIASQGLVKWVPICVGDVVTHADGKKGFQITNVSSPRVTFTEGEVQWLQVGPGFAERVPEYYVPYDWPHPTPGTDPSKINFKFKFEHRAFNGPALVNLGVGRAASQPTVLDTDSAQWIVSDGGPEDKRTSSLALRIAARQATLLGTGMMLWRFRSTYAYPELECGDCVAVPTDRFVALNPLGGGAIVGKYWAHAVIVETSTDHRTFGVWIRQWSDLSPTLQTSVTGTTGTTDEADLVFDVVRNGGFEEGLGEWMPFDIPSPAYDSTGLTASIETAAPAKGAKSLKLTHDRTVGTTYKAYVQSNQRQAGGPTVPLKTHVRPGESLRTLFTSKDDDANLQISVGVIEWGHTKNYLRATGFLAVHSVAYANYETPLTVGADCYYVTPFIVLDNTIGAATTHAWFDEMHVFRKGTA